MTRATQMHIEYLREMIESDNEKLAAFAAKELAEIIKEHADKGIIIV